MFKENLTPVAFKFNATSQSVRSVLIENEPFFIAKDVCDVLGLKNSRIATATLDDDERADVRITYTSSNRTTQKRRVQAVSESGLYALIMRSNKKEAKVFRKWITKEVLPSIRKKGFYGLRKTKGGFIDARDVPYTTNRINGYNVRTVELEGIKWVNINDTHQAIRSATSNTQVAYKLNAKQRLAIKIWIFGSTNPAWFTNELGLQLILAGSRKLRDMGQLKLL